MIVVVKNEIELQNALNSAVTTNVTKIDIQEDIVVTTPMSLPKQLKNKSKMLMISGNGHSIEAATATIPAIMQRVPADQTEANSIMQSKAFVIEDLNFIGKWDTINNKQICLNLGATYNSIIRNCKFSGANVGLHLKFALMTRVENCLATNIRHSAFIADSGDWVGAGVTNAQSNHTKFEQCRVFCATGSFTGFGIYSASGVEINRCIVEGQNPSHWIYFDAENSSVVKDFTIRGTHCETKALVSGLKVRTKDGYIDIDGMFSQYPCLMFDMESTGGYPDVQINHIPYLPGGTTFKSTPQFVWETKNMPGNFDITATTLWADGKVPVYYYSERNNQSRTIQTNKLTLNTIELTKMV